MCPVKLIDGVPKMSSRTRNQIAKSKEQALAGATSGPSRTTPSC
jgi:hypothetical protein